MTTYTEEGCPFKDNCSDPHHKHTDTTSTEIEAVRKLDYIQAMIWARINDEAQLRNIKLTSGDCYALGSVIKEVLHPEVEAYVAQREKAAYEKGVQDGKTN